MTRARLLEKVIADWLERDGWRASDFGLMEYEIERGPASVLIATPELAETIDAELDRIIRETAA